MHKLKFKEKSLYKMSRIYTRNFARKKSYLHINVYSDFYMKNHAGSRGEGHHLVVVTKSWPAAFELRLDVSQSLGKMFFIQYEFLAKR